MPVDYRPATGTPITGLDTPCLVVDLDALEHNFRIIAETYRDTVCKMRQHTKNIKSPAVAHKQIRMGGTLNGVCTAKVSEAEVMVQAGITDILIPNNVVTREKLARLCSLAKEGDIKVCVDNAENMRTISEVAQEWGVKIGVLLEVDTSMGRGGIRGVDQGVQLAKLATSLSGVTFRGVMSHQSVQGKPDRETRVIEAHKWVKKVMVVKDAIEAAGIPVEMVSSGETFCYDIVAEIPGVTEVEGGTYALMSTQFSYMTEFKIAGKVLGTIVSTPRPGIAIGDTGIRAMASPGGMMPSVDSMPGVTVESIHDEHIVLKTDGRTQLAVGDQYMLLPAHQDMLVNRWDQFIAFRNGVVEEVWDIPGRGCFH